MDHKGWHSRGYLPHFDSQDVVQFVTFRLADSLPKEAVLKLRGTARPESLRDELLDQGLGACWLRSDRIARIVEDAFLVFDGERYRLHAWTIMPNHVHVLLTVLPATPLGTIVSSWKRASRHEKRAARSAEPGRSGKMTTGIGSSGTTTISLRRKAI
jgi:putative transposase